jgi:hypothetical protein
MRSHLGNLESSQLVIPFNLTRTLFYCLQLLKLYRILLLQSIINIRYSVSLQVLLFYIYEYFIKSIAHT